MTTSTCDRTILFKYDQLYNSVLYIKAYTQSIQSDTHRGIDLRTKPILFNMPVKFLLEK